ncbi:MAG: aminopeptidase [Thermoplasmata archaeon]|nr:aminopeptidase [Thermoplasmata archaeon]
MAPDEAPPAAVAEALLGKALRVRRGENVIIESWSHTLPYAAACVVEARRLGAHPMLLLEEEGAFWESLERAPNSGRWSGVARHEGAALGNAHAYVFFPGPADRPRFRNLPNARSRQNTTNNDEWYRRARAAKLRAVRSVLGYASDQQAAHWGVSGAAWRTALSQATVGVDYAALVKDAQRASAKLQSGTTLRITAANGTDVTLKLRRRRPMVDDGVVTPQDVKDGAILTVSPPGTVVVAVDEKSAEGVAIANRPSFLRSGRVEGGQWEMKAGKLSNFWYTDGQAAFEEVYRPAGKGRDVVGLFSLGLNPALPPGVPQVEDQEAGAVTLAVGGNHAQGGTNRSPFISWIVLGEATVAVDGKPVCDRGKLL